MSVEGSAWVLGTSDTQRKFIAALVYESQPGWVVSIEPPTRTLEQNAALHAALTDIMEQLRCWPKGSNGPAWDLLTWKRMATLSYLRDQGVPVTILPALDGNGFDVLAPQTSKMSVKTLSGLLDWCHCFGAEQGVTFKARAA